MSPFNSIYMENSTTPRTDCSRFVKGGNIQSHLRARNIWTLLRLTEPRSGAPAAEVPPLVIATGKRVDAEGNHADNENRQTKHGSNGNDIARQDRTGKQKH